MRARKHQVRNGQVLVIREAVPEDARALLNYVEAVSGESDFLTFGPGEFELTEEQEADFLREARDHRSPTYDHEGKPSVGHSQHP